MKKLSVGTRVCLTSRVLQTYPDLGPRKGTVMEVHLLIPPDYYGYCVLFDHEMLLVLLGQDALRKASWEEQEK